MTDLLVFTAGGNSFAGVDRRQKPACPSQTGIPFGFSCPGRPRSEASEYVAACSVPRCKPLFEEMLLHHYTARLLVDPSVSRLSGLHTLVLQAIGIHSLGHMSYVLR